MRNQPLSNWLHKYRQSETGSKVILFLAFMLVIGGSLWLFGVDNYLYLILVVPILAFSYVFIDTGIMDGYAYLYFSKEQEQEVLDELSNLGFRLVSEETGKRIFKRRDGIVEKAILSFEGDTFVLKLPKRLEKGFVEIYYGKSRRE